MSLLLAPTSSDAQALRKLGDMQLRLVGLSATVDPLNPTIPKNIASGVRVVIAGGGQVVTPADAVRLLGEFSIEGELSGPGLGAPVTLRQAVAAGTTATDLLLPIPALAVGGAYALANLRLVAGGRPVLDVTPSTVPISVIEQVLITSVQTRALTLQEIRDRGIVLDSDDYLGFEFTLGLRLESRPISVSFPVVFGPDNQPTPSYIAAPTLNLPPGVAPVQVPTLVPLLLELPVGANRVVVDGQEREIRIPSVLVIPGDVGYLRQFFSAQLFVANGAPGASGLAVRDLSGTLTLPPGADGVRLTADDPLSLAETVRGVQPLTMAVRGLGPDGAPDTADDDAVLSPGEQGQAEFLVRGDLEGFHTLTFDIAGVLDGLPIGPVDITGRASGGVLVRNPFFDVSFAVPSVVRDGEPFTLYATVTNKGQGLANAVSMTLDASRMSGAALTGSPTQVIDTLAPGDARTLAFGFISQRTGEVVASYLKFDGPGATGNLQFTIAVGERGVRPSPDTLVLPSQVTVLPAPVVAAAMRVLGQAWSVANAPLGTLPAGVQRIGKQVVTDKALALAEAGLRQTLGQPPLTALRDLLVDFHGGTPLDVGFDQLLRETNAGHAFDQAVGAALAPAVGAAGSAGAFERAFAQVAVSGADFASFSVATAGGPLSVALVDAGGRRTAATVAPDPLARGQVRSAAIVPLGPTATAPLFGLVTAPSSAPYTIALEAAGPGVVDLSVTYPRGDGAFTHGTAVGVSFQAGSRARLALDPARAAPAVEVDLAGDGTFESATPLTIEQVSPQPPQLLAAVVVGPETLPTAGPFGKHMAVLFDRTIDATPAAVVANYVVPRNTVLSARRQLSGRLVFATLAQPEGALVPTSLTVTGMRDLRGTWAGALFQPLSSRIPTPAAVVSGRVLGGDGAPVVGADVYFFFDYSNWIECQFNPDTRRPLHGTTTDDTGAYEFRYVPQGPCAGGWMVQAQDPVTRAVRSNTGRVSVDGERITANLQLLGRGTVAGTVRTSTGTPVPGASVIAVSLLDPQYSGRATSDGAGRFTIADLAVGGISLRALKGVSVGSATAQIPRAGATVTADLTMNSGVFDVAGTVRRVENGATTPAVGVFVTLEVPNPFPRPPAYVPVASAQTSGTGAYALIGVPAGVYRLTTQLETGDTSTLTGTAAPGDVLLDRDLVVSVVRSGRVTGTVRYANGTPAAGAVVTLDGRGVQAGADGAFALLYVSARPSPQQIFAYAADGSRRGVRDVLLTTPGQVLTGVEVTLAGAGTVDVVVVDGAGQPVSNQQVYVTRAGLQVSGNQCLGLAAAITGTNGHALLPNLEVGAVTLRAVRQVSGLIDVGSVTTSLTADGQTAATVLRFGGHGSVSGVVLRADGSPVHGADVELTSQVYDSTACQWQPGVSHVVRTNTLGQFQMTGVPVGAVRVSAQDPFSPVASVAGAAGVLAVAGQAVTFTLRLTDTMAGVLSGTVLMPDGVTPAGGGIQVTATGALPDVVVTTNAQGHFQFAPILPRGWHELTLRDPATGGTARSLIYLPQGQPLTITPRLLGRNTVRVIVVDGAGVAVSSAFVRLRETGYPSLSYAGAVAPATQGAATFDRVFEGPLAIEASDSLGRGGRTETWLTGDGRTVDVTVRLTVTGTVRGRFLRPDGVTPIPLASVRVLASGRTIGEMTTSTGADAGRFEFLHVPAGAVRVEALDAATGRQGIAAGTLATEGQVLDLDVRAQGLGTVAGVVRSNGAPVIALVEVVSGTTRVSTTADATGTYSVPGVPEGPVTVTASLSGGALAGVASGTLSGDDTTLMLDVALRDAGAVSGVVVQADGTTPASAAVVTLSVGGLGGGTQSAATAENGAFAFARVPAGSATLDVAAVGSIDRGRATALITGNATATVTVQLNGVGGLTGHTRTAGGAPVAGSLELRGTGAFPYTQSLTIDAAGSFTFPAVLAGPFTASLTSSVGGFTLRGTAAGVAQPGQTTTFDVTLQPSASVIGRVFRPDGTTPAVGAEVTVSAGPIGNIRVTVPVVAAGTFRADGIPLGAITLRVVDAISGGAGFVGGLTAASDGQLLAVGDLVLDNTPLTVVSSTPADGALNVPVTTPIVLVLSDAVPNVFTAVTGISVKSGGTAWPHFTALSADGRTVTITPQPVGAWPGWPDGVEMTIEVLPGLQDVFGRAALPFLTRFRSVDLSAPTVTAIAPANGAIQVPGASSVVVTFDEAVDASTTLATLVTVTSAAGAIAGTTTLTTSTVATFVPAAPLPDNAVYSVVVNGARDGVGNVQTTPFNATFVTTDTVPPVVTPGNPPPASWTNVAAPQVSALLSDSLSGINPPFDILTVDGVAIGATQGTSVVFGPVPTPLTDGPHTAAASARDRAGNLGATSWTFNIDTVPPTAPLITGVTNGQSVSGTVTIGATSTDTASGVLRMELYRNGQFMTFLLPPSFSTSAAVAGWGEGNHVLSARALDVAGTWSAIGPTVSVTVNDVSPPFVLTFTPTNTAANVAPTTPVTVRFTEAVRDTNLDGVITLTGPSGIVAGVVARTAADTLTFAPAVALEPGVTYTAAVQGARDLAGNVQTLNRTWTFSTAGGATLRVTFQTALGQPIAGQVIEVSGGNGYRTATTDVAGRASFANLIAGTYDFSATVAGRWPSYQQVTVGPADAGTTIDRTLLRSPVGDLRVRVRLGGVTPVPNVVVTVNDSFENGLSQVTNQTGEAVFEDLSRAGGVVSLTVAYGFAPSETRTVTMVDDGELVVDFSPIALRGTVRFVDGAPVVTPSVFAYQTGHALTAELDPSVPGGFVILGPVAGEPLTISAQDPDSGLQAADIVVTIVDPAAPPLVPITLPPDGTVTGTLRTAQGAPIADAAIQLYSDGGGATRSATTAADGTYTVTRVALGVIAVTAQTLDGPGAAATGTLATSGQTVTINLATAPYGTVVGVVRDGLGTPVDGVFVSVDTALAGFGATDALGAYTHPYVGLGAFTATAYLGGSNVTGTATGTLSVANATVTADITLGAYGSVTGVVRNETGQPVAGATVQVLAAGVPVLGALTDATGAYQVIAAVGTYEVRALAGGLRTETAPVVVTTQGQAVARDLTLQSTPLTVTVLRANGTPPPYAYVYTRPAGELYYTRSAVANAAGVATFTRHAPGAIEVLVTYSTSATATVTLVNGVPGTLTITLP